MAEPQKSQETKQAKKKPGPKPGYKKPQPKKSTAPQIKRTQRGTRVEVCDHFKAEVCEVKYNRSYQKGVVTIEPIEHAHFFHTINSRMQRKNTTTSNAGHFHEIIMKADADGNLVAECGPPMKTISVKTPVGYKKRVVPLKWEDAINERWVEDKHQHKMRYIDSETISEQGVKAIQQDNQAQIADLGIASGGIKVTAPAPATAEDGISE